jgi:colicin import membrane protein
LLFLNFAYLYIIQSKNTDSEGFKGKGKAKAKAKAKAIQTQRKLDELKKVYDAATQKSAQSNPAAYQKIIDIANQVKAGVKFTPEMAEQSKQAYEDLQKSDPAAFQAQYDATRDFVLAKKAKERAEAAEARQIQAAADAVVKAAADAAAKAKAEAETAARAAAIAQAEAEAAAEAAAIEAAEAVYVRPAAVY